jgi:hypothetical protein
LVTLIFDEHRCSSRFLAHGACTRALASRAGSAWQPATVMRLAFDVKRGVRCAAHTANGLATAGAGDLESDHLTQGVLRDL